MGFDDLAWVLLHTPGSDQSYESHDRAIARWDVPGDAAIGL
jgi:hypothetical protein